MEIDSRTPCWREVSPLRWREVLPVGVRFPHFWEGPPLGGFAHWTRCLLPAETCVCKKAVVVRRSCANCCPAEPGPFLHELPKHFTYRECESTDAAWGHENGQKYYQLQGAQECNACFSAHVQAVLHDSRLRRSFWTDFGGSCDTVGSEKQFLDRFWGEL